MSTVVFSGSNPFKCVDMFVLTAFKLSEEKVLINEIHQNFSAQGIQMFPLWGEF